MNKIIAIAILLCAFSFTVRAGVVQPSATSIPTIEVLDPCGHQSPLDEVFLKIGGTPYILSVYTNIDPFLADPQSRLILVPNLQNQPTRDGTGCIFSVNNGVMTD